MSLPGSKATYTVIIVAKYKYVHGNTKYKYGTRLRHAERNTLGYRARGAIAQNDGVHVHVVHNVDRRTWPPSGNSAA